VDRIAQISGLSKEQVILILSEENNRAIGQFIRQLDNQNPNHYYNMLAFLYTNCAGKLGEFQIFNSMLAIHFNRLDSVNIADAVNCDHPWEKYTGLIKASGRCSLRYLAGGMPLPPYKEFLKWTSDSSMPNIQRHPGFINSQGQFDFRDGG